MRVSTVARRLAQFRKLYSPYQIERYSKLWNLQRYYKAMIGAEQVELVLSEPDSNGHVKLLASCEVWFVKESEVDKIIPTTVPSTLSFGKIAFIANITLDPSIEGKYFLYYIKHLLKQKYPYCPRCFWYSHKRKRRTKIFEVQRNGSPHTDRSSSGRFNRD